MKEPSGSFFIIYGHYKNLIINQPDIRLYERMVNKIIIELILNFKEITIAITSIVLQFYT